MSQEKVFRKGGVVVRGDKAHLRADHTTTVNRSEAAPRTASSAQLQAATAALSGAPAPPKPPRDISTVAGYAYGALGRVLGKKTFRRRDGTAATLFKSSNVLGGGMSSGVMNVGPHSVIKFKLDIADGDFSQLDLSDSLFSARDMINFDFSGSTLDGGKFSPDPDDAWRTTMGLVDVKFRGASLRGLSFEAVSLSGYCDFREADVADVNFSDVDFAASGANELDVRGANITREQFDDLNARVPVTYANGSLEPVYHDRCRITYDEYGMDEFCAALDLDRDTLKVLLWAGDVEARDNFSKEAVRPEDFDPGKHHFPQWEVQRLLTQTRSA